MTRGGCPQCELQRLHLDQICKKGVGSDELLEGADERAVTIVEGRRRISPDSPAVEAEQKGAETVMAAAAREIGHGNGC